MILAARQITYLLALLCLRRSTPWNGLVRLGEPRRDGSERASRPRLWYEEIQLTE